jgi:UDP-N-acetylmuramoyl-tripeptide--D-alanyl-D-alanine ligase
VPLGDAVRRLETVGPAPERLEPVPLDSGAWLVCDTFKGAVETYESAIEALAEIPGRRLAVVGEVESPLEGQGAVYRRLGARVAAIAERVIVVGGRKVFLSYRSGARQVSEAPDLVVHAGDSVHAAAGMLRAELRAGDVVLLKGAGRQRLQRIALLLRGDAVACRLVDCRAPARVTCATCPWRERQAPGAAAPPPLSAASWARSGR